MVSRALCILLSILVAAVIEPSIMVPEFDVGGSDRRRSLRVIKSCKILSPDCTNEPVMESTEEEILAFDWNPIAIPILQINRLANTSMKGD